MTEHDALHDEATLAIERALVGALLLDRDAIASVVERLRPGSFLYDSTRLPYVAICSLWERRVPPDPLTVYGELARSNVPGPTLGELCAMQTECFANGWTVHAPHYADLIVQAAKRRAVAAAGVSLVQRAQADPTADPAELFHAALADLDGLGAGPDGGPLPYAELVEDYEERVHRLRSGELVADVTPTGFRWLDRRLGGGFLPGELIVLAARPGMGKTSLAMQFAHNAARRGRRVLIFSAEMGVAALMDRAAAEVSGVAPSMVTAGTLPDHRWDAFLKAVDRLRLLPIEVDDTSGLTTDAMLVRVQRAQVHGPVRLVVFDYLELAGDQVKGDSEERRVAAISRRMKHLARVCDVPVLLLCQLNRQVEGRRERVPTLADLRYSGAIEQDADKVLFIYRSDYYRSLMVGQETEAERVERDKKAGIADVIVAKHRSGETGTVSLRFVEETMSFREIDE